MKRIFIKRPLFPAFRCEPHAKRPKLDDNAIIRQLEQDYPEPYARKAKLLQLLQEFKHKNEHHPVLKIYAEKLHDQILSNCQYY